MSDEAKVTETELYDFVESFFMARHGIQVRESGVLCDLIRAAIERFGHSRMPLPEPPKP